MTKLTTPGTYLASLREHSPLVQCITNYVAMNIAANVLLAAGASPAMVHAEEEAGEFAGFSGAVTINMGTISPAWVDGMKVAAAGTTAAGRPWVLDPVAHMATGYRRRIVGELMALNPTIIRGNASEIIALAGGTSAAKGVDAKDPVEAAEAAALELAAERRCVVAVTGVTDYVTDGARSARISGGSSLMPRVTALGCSLTALVGAYAALDPSDRFATTIAALSHFAVAGEEAGRSAAGPGSFSVGFLDALARIDPAGLDARARVVVL
ncbi:hydroxyethylthiazole kinase [Rhizobium sp. RU36D]|uniref:hydroxyethylthiazole kinase n=1 Tax=Rhizobium sp. RU36D TaxID=1907415 RepID=UPI0009D8E9F2|nr:hydroxyethylthiazole kinase [Rhizobium sp. RU36D]SMD04837.1 hydroxyethylthiazole kinase [Rhizobium sp. RU36D]